jgi:hypothetical protein
VYATSNTYGYATRERRRTRTGHDGEGRSRRRRPGRNTARREAIAESWGYR